MQNTHKEFAQERANKDGHKYGLEIVRNFNPEVDLVTWDVNYNYPEVVTMEFPEWTALCPLSGYRDTGTVKITYIPDSKTMELKSAKLFINHYDNTHISHEDCAQDVFKWFAKKLEPKYLKVEMLPAPRGNVTTTVVIEVNFGKETE